MNKPKRSTPFVIVLLFLIGAGAMAFALWLVDHRQAIPDSSRATMIRNSPPYAPPRPELIGTVYGMMPGQKYLVTQSFTDFYGNAFERGEQLRFKQRHFLPYDGGHTIVFDERSLYLQEDKNKQILDNFSEYIAQMRQ